MRKRFDWAIRACADRVAVVVGGANSAGQAALFLARRAGHVHVLIRRDDLSETMSSYLAQRLLHHERITVHPRSELTAVRGGTGSPTSRGTTGLRSATSTRRPARCS